MDVNVRKTKGVQLLDGKRKVTARIDPSGVSRERVGFNSNVFSVKSGSFAIAQMASNTT